MEKNADIIKNIITGYKLVDKILRKNMQYIKSLVLIGLNGNEV